MGRESVPDCVTADRRFQKGIGRVSGCSIAHFRNCRRTRKLWPHRILARSLGCSLWMSHQAPQPEVAHPETGRISMVPNRVVTTPGCPSTQLVGARVWPRQAWSLPAPFRSRRLVPRGRLLAARCSSDRLGNTPIALKLALKFLDAGEIRHVFLERRAACGRSRPSTWRSPRSSRRRE